MRHAGVVTISFQLALIELPPVKMHLNVSKTSKMSMGMTSLGIEITEAVDRLVDSEGALSGEPEAEVHITMVKEALIGEDLSVATPGIMSMVVNSYSLLVPIVKTFVVVIEE